MDGWKPPIADGRNLIRAISGGVPAIPKKELKHMVRYWVIDFKIKRTIFKALIGVDEDGQKNWFCAGSLIHEKYVLTAAHCLYKKQGWPISRKIRNHNKLFFRDVVKYVRLGDLDYNSNNDESVYQEFNVSKIFKHPNYSFPVVYNDIALLKLNKPARFDVFVQPACLHTEKLINYSTAELVVAGWGKTEALADKGSSHLRKAVVQLFSDDICKDIYKNDSRRLFRGIDADLQLCAGSEVDESNTCKVF